MPPGPLTSGIAGGLLGITGGVVGAIQSERQQRRFRRRQRRAIGEARQFADERVAEITGGPLFSQAVDFLQGTFENTADSPLAQDFARGIRQAQATRGTLFGGAGVAQEASGLAAFSQELRQSLLPQLLTFATEPERLRQSVLGFEAPLRVAAATGAALPGLTPQPLLQSPIVAGLNSGIAGFSGGAQIGASFQNLSQQRQDIERLQALQLSGAANQQQGVGQAGLSDSLLTLLSRLSGAA